MILDANSKTFIVYMAIKKQEKILVYLEKHVQIKAKT